jgi:hypothetical protein
MTAAALVADLVGRGVVLMAHGDRLRFRPATSVTEADRQALLERKADVLALLARRSEDSGLIAAWHDVSAADRARLEAEASAGDPLAQTVLQTVACMPDACAWKLYSQRLNRELWVARDDDALADLAAEGIHAGLPVVLAAELEELRQLDTATLAAVLDVKATFGPGTRLAYPEGNA